jgi:quinohemoprotein ethanol dehydrogenase
MEQDMVYGIPSVESGGVFVAEPLNSEWPTELFTAYGKRGLDINRFGGCKEPMYTQLDTNHGSSRARVFLFVALCLCLASLSARTFAASPAPSKFGAVDDQRLRNAASEPEQWFTGGRDGNGTYYSPLTQINDSNVTQLGFAWEYRLGTYRGLEATPIVVDGVMFTSGITGLVYALDARTGKAIWTFDPQIDPQIMRFPCCDIVNRGVAVRNGLVYVASLDGRLFALDAATGQKKWSVDTIVDHKVPGAAYTSTGAPQIAKDVVVIGNSGADMGVGGVRGYVTAYDLKSGAERWRFYTVPALNEKNPSPEMMAAAKTWDPNRNASVRGGGTAWDGMAYDPDLNLLYVGTGNSAPYKPAERSPNGGDNLYLSSIVAINPDTGRMSWYYQTTPGDNWDFTAVQKMILADLTINGKKRKVIMQAPKNGYFYVLDRATGKVISAAPYAHVSWSKGLDANFRPIVSPDADYSHETKLIWPNNNGAHNWQPMSYSPQTGLVYIPVSDAPMIIGDLKNSPLHLGAMDGGFGVFSLFPDRDFDAKSQAAVYGKMPAFDPVDPKSGRSLIHFELKAWDPVAQKAVWVQPVSQDYWTKEGGVMSTAGNLVFQGTSTGELRVHAANNGELLHSIQTGTMIMAAPSTYMIDGVQYVAVMAGSRGHGSSARPNSEPARYDNEGRILVFRLGGAREVPRTAARVVQPMNPPPAKTGSAQDIAYGMKTYAEWCSRCHASNWAPDLRRLDHSASLEAFKAIVLGGALATRGMGRFDDVLKPVDVEKIHLYLIDEANKLYASDQKRKSRGPAGQGGH